MKQSHVCHKNTLLKQFFWTVSFIFIFLYVTFRGFNRNSIPFIWFPTFCSLPNHFEKQNIHLILSAHWDGFTRTFRWHGELVQIFFLKTEARWTIKIRNPSVVILRALLLGPFCLIQFSSVVLYSVSSQHIISRHFTRKTISMSVIKQCSQVQMNIEIVLRSFFI